MGGIQIHFVRLSDSFIMVVPATSHAMAAPRISQLLIVFAYVAQEFE